ncbi:MAG TPA: ribosome biogenesis GTPase Der [Frankiaceae bacterium]|nr:ribosome biogenesis GTPase Der [Frankiaceae bacterium]
MTPPAPDAHPDELAEGGDETVSGDGAERGRLPVLAIVGRPNVGKSTLVNRFLGRREAVVEDVPGVTRDRVAYDTAWRGRAFTVVDTGGWDPDADGLSAKVAEQAEVAVVAADAVLMVVDATVGATEADRVVARILQRSRRPVVLAANKVDDQRLESDVAELWSLGLGEPFPVSGLHGRGSGDLLDAVLDALPEAPPETDTEAGPRRIALIGRPNVGKSSLLNRLLGDERVLVDNVAGTTRDPVDSLVDIAGTTYRFVDTAGLRRRVREAKGAEYYSSVRTIQALDAAEVAIVLVDAGERLTEQDQRVLATVVEAGRALVLAVNKWDVLDEDRHEELERDLRNELGRTAWAPRVNISARTGRGVDKLGPAIEIALESWERRIPTARLNSWLTEVVGRTPPPPRGGKAPRVLFATQAGTRPPKFVLFTSGPLEPGYLRFVERRLREDFGFPGTPLDIQVRVKERQRRGRK